MFGRISLGKSTGSNSNRDSCKVTSSVTNNRGVRTDFDSSGRVCSVSNESSGSGANFPSGSDRDHPSGRSYNSGGSGVEVSTQLTNQVQNLSINTPQVPQAPDNYSSASLIPARKGVTIDDCIVDIGEGKKAINCSGIQSKHSKDTSLEGKLQISQAICNVLSLRETKVKNPYIANNIKVIDLSNCNINSEDVRFFSSRVAHLDLDLDALNIGNNPLGNIGAEKLLCYSVLNYSVTHTLRHIDLSNCTLGDNGAIHFSTASKNWNRIESADLSNNAIGDPGARAIANAFYHGQFPHLKGLDFHGNKISPEGYGYLAKILETVPRQMQTKDIAITLEVHNSKSSVLNFVKKGIKYAIEQHSKKQEGTKWDIHKVRSDQEIDKWKDCKDTVSNIGMGYLVGLVKCSSSSPSKDPYSMFICSTRKGGWKGIAKPETLNCIADVSKLISPPEDIDQFTTLVGETHDGCEIM